MTKFYLLKAGGRFLFLTFALSVLLSLSPGAQLTTCTSTFTQCVGMQETFTGSANGFTSTGFTYNNNALRVASTNPNTDYTITSRIFTLATNDVLTVGFSTTGSTANLSSYRIEVLNAATGAVLATCSDPANPAAGPICYTLTDTDIDAGLQVRYRITIRTAGGNNNTIVFDNFTFLDAQQVPLAVSFKNFTASRSGRNVSVRWETATEANSKGFEIQRKTNRSDFETIGFVASASEKGTSTKTLQYAYTDQNDFQGGTVYRIKQIDFDGKVKYSDLRLVNGGKNSSQVIVYPNPVVNGTASVTFSTRDVRDIQLMDQSGRVVSQWNGYAAQDLKITNMKSGVYMLKVLNKATMQSDIQQIVVAK
jgi:hypothetical protein